MIRSNAPDKLHEFFYSCCNNNAYKCKPGCAAGTADLHAKLIFLFKSMFLYQNPNVSHGSAIKWPHPASCHRISD
jgi:hypothetical protein